MWGETCSFFARLVGIVDIIAVAISTPVVVFIVGVFGLALSVGSSLVN